MKKLLAVCLLLVASGVKAQAPDSINENYIKRVIYYLASDKMNGRGNFTPELYKAAMFITSEMAAAKLNYFPGYTNYLLPFITTEHLTDSLKVDSVITIPKGVLLNVVGMLEGKSKPGEAIIFSAHYDHVGNKHNGANDNASGVTAMLAIMHYYSIHKTNERTLVFCAFAGEEIGLLGSKAFADQVEPSAIKAVINLEMLGRTNLGGKKALMLTGDQHSDLFQIVKKNLKGSSYAILRDGKLDKKLFARSDNYPFHLIGIPAHTFMSSDDDDNCYHQPCDKPKTLNIPNMVHLVQAIILATSTVVQGTDTPKLK